MDIVMHVSRTFTRDATILIGSDCTKYKEDHPIAIKNLFYLIFESQIGLKTYTIKN